MYNKIKLAHNSYFIFIYEQLTKATFKLKTGTFTNIQILFINLLLSTMFSLV